MRATSRSLPRGAQRPQSNSSNHGAWDRQTRCVGGARGRHRWPQKRGDLLEAAVYWLTRTTEVTNGRKADGGYNYGALGTSPFDAP